MSYGARKRHGHGEESEGESRQHVFVCHNWQLHHDLVHNGSTHYYYYFFLIFVRDFSRFVSLLLLFIIILD